MPRMRVVKPDFWSDSKMVRLSPYARLLYMGMWNFALCDKGHLPDDPDELKLKILPADPVDPEELINELVKLDRVRRMVTEDGENFLWVVRLDRHQKLDERWKTRCPYCTAPRVTPIEPEGTPRHSREFRGDSQHHGDDATHAPPPADTRATARGEAGGRQADRPPEDNDPHRNSPETQRDSRESHRGSPELIHPRPVVGSKGWDGIGEDAPGRGSTVTNSRAGRDLDEPPPNGTPGIAEQILTEWRNTLKKPALAGTIDDVGQFVASALRQGQHPDDVRNAVRTWQERISREGARIGPGVLRSILHEITQRDPNAGADVVPLHGRASPIGGHFDPAAGHARALAREAAAR